MESIRCGRCAALLFKAGTGALRGPVQIKCRRCGTVNHVRATGSESERHRAPEDEMTGGPKAAPSA